MTTEPATYDYLELADRIEAALGQRPALSSLRAARTADRRRAAPRSWRRPSLTTSMPDPVPASSPTAPARFDAGAIETWLANHPCRTWDAAVDAARERLASGDPVETVVAQVLEAGLSWQVITEVISAHDQRVWTKAGIHKKYRHLEP